MAKKEKMRDDELTAILDDRKYSALNYRDGELSSRRENLLQRYLGKQYGNERDGQSKVVTRQCLEAVEWTLPSLLRVFLSSPTIAEFEPIGPEDEATAALETAALNDALFKKNDGFMTIYTWLKDTLMNPVGYAKVFWDESEHTEVEDYEGLMAQQADELLNQDGVEAIEQEVRDIVVETPLGPQPLEVYDLKIRRTTTKGRPVVTPVPPEELTIDDKLTTVSLDNADFINQESQKTRSQLIEMGFDKDTVYELASMNEQNDETRSRHDAAEERGTALDRQVVSDDSMELVEVNETYAYLDYDGDGVAEYRKIIWVDETVLENEEADMCPFIAMTAVPIPHVHVGAGWMELVEDLQKIHTTLMRQLLNNMYRTNNPRTVVGRGVNISDLLSDLPNQPIRAENIDNMRTEPVAPVIGQVLPAFATLDSMGERRIGVSKTTMGLDADALARVTNDAFDGNQDQSNQRIEALARVLSESGIKPLMLKLHKLLMTHQTEGYQMKIAGQWQGVNPTEWRERDDLTVTVGLGTGNRPAQMRAVNRVMEVQGAMLQSGKAHLVSDQNLYNASAKLIEVSGLHGAEKYFTDPAQNPQPPQQPQEDPMVAVQREMVQVESQKVQLKAQTDMATLKQKSAESEQKMQGEIVKLQAQLRKQNQDTQIRNRDLDIKEGSILLNSELEQTRLDMDNMRDLEATQNAFRQEAGETE